MNIPSYIKIPNKTLWQNYGLSNAILLRSKNKHVIIPCHDGEMNPGFIREDLLPAVIQLAHTGKVTSPVTAEIDPTWKCQSKNNCGGHCFSSIYRADKNYSMSFKILKKFMKEFRENGGKIVRWDGGGEPLLHESIRNGELVEVGSNLQLKQTILSNGALLNQSNTSAFINGGIYLRISLNAAKPETHLKFHGCPQSFSEILGAIEKYIVKKESSTTLSDVPLGVTFLVSDLNYKEVYDCAHIAKQIGVNHFFVRRVLGPSWLRKNIYSIHEEKIRNLFSKVEGLRSEKFLPFVPWRTIAEPDLKASDIQSKTCWQSILKTVIEPTSIRDEMNFTLCGRYRGNGIGQLKQMDIHKRYRSNTHFQKFWNNFTKRPNREELMQSCPSCIDRGFINLVNYLLHGLNFISAQEFTFDSISIKNPDEIRYYEVIETDTTAEGLSTL